MATGIFLSLIIFGIDPRYHIFSEIANELDSLARHYPDIAFLDTIGYTTRDSLSIFALKISDHAWEEEDEPAILYLANHHAEEILGIEICMYMIEDLIGNYQISDTVRNWVDNQEIWFVPLLNAEGHGVVMSGLDTIWRKNKRDNNNNGFFDLDYDGVDLNRNYDFYWSQGGSTEPSSENYRGPAPFSENEAKAVSDLCMKQNFIFCNEYHSARTGLGEVIYYPWTSGEGYSPDFPFIREIADSMSKRIINDQGDGHYMSMAGSGLDGMARNWLYGICGIFTYTIEVSTTTIQPGWMVDDICQRNILGAYYLLDRVNGSGITGCVYDSLTNMPLSAEIIVVGYYDSRLPPRQSKLDFGRFLRILAPGVYNIEIHKYGYASKYIPGVIVENQKLTNLDVYLHKTEYNLISENNEPNLSVNPNPINNTVIIHLSKPANFSVIKIFDASGRLVKTFTDPADNIIWQRNDRNNKLIANGVYWVVGEMTGQRLTKKVVVLN